MLRYLTREWGLMSSQFTAPEFAPSMDLRKAKRYQLSALAAFCWAGSDGKLQDRLGVTRDICVTGVAIVSDVAPPQGSAVELDVYFPANAVGRAVQLHGEGKVTRVERQQETTIGFAAEVNFQTRPSSEAVFPNPGKTQ